MGALISLALKFLPTVLGWFGISGASSDTQAAQASGEAQGKAEQRATTDDKILTDISTADAVRRDVASAPPVGLRDDDGFRRE